jgi:hypothetical protein
MCNSNVHLDQDPVEILAQIHHNLLTAADDLQVFTLTHPMAEPTPGNLTAASSLLIDADGLVLGEVERAAANRP